MSSSFRSFLLQCLAFSFDDKGKYQVGNLFHLRDQCQQQSRASSAKLRRTDKSCCLSSGTCHSHFAKEMGFLFRETIVFPTQKHSFKSRIQKRGRYFLLYQNGKYFIRRRDGNVLACDQFKVVACVLTLDPCPIKSFHISQIASV